MRRENAINGKSSASPCSTPSRNDEETRIDSPSSEKSLSRCVERRFRIYSQLPVRCTGRTSPYYRPPGRTAFRLIGLRAINHSPSINTAKSCPDSLPCGSIFRVIGTPGCKKSLSMIDLSPTVELEHGDLRSESDSTLERSEETRERAKEVNDDGFHGCTTGSRFWMDDLGSESDEGTSRFRENPRKAASLVCRVLVLNAWRRRRAEIVQLHDTIEGLGQQVEHLHLQIVVLRRLLETENARVGRMSTEVHRVKAQLEETQRERDALRMEKERAEEETRRSNEISEERFVSATNLRNELLSAQSQLKALDEQISRDRAKLLKLREDERILLDKVSATEALAEERGAKVEKAESTLEELRSKLADQTARVESLQQQIQRLSKELKANEVEKSKLSKRLRLTEETEKSLNERTILLEAQLADRETNLRRLESAFNARSSELNELKDRLIRRSQEGGWSSRMLQIAGSVVRAPRAILRTLSLFSGAPLQT